MKIYLGGLIGLAFVFLFSSCQKEVNESLPDQITSADSTYLDKLIMLDTTQPVGMDSLEKHVFQYDNSKRLTRFATYFFPVLGPDTLLSEFFYLSNETLPYKEVHHDTYFSGSGTIHSVDTIYYTYTNGLVSKDSIILWEMTSNHNFGVDVSQYSVQGNRVTTYSRHYDAVSGNYVLVRSDTSTSTTAYAGGNLVSQTRTSGPANKNSVQVLYDNKTNPLAKVIKIKYPIFELVSGIDWYSQSNNPLNVHSQDEPSDPFEDLDLNYKYRADNYPVSATIRDMQTGVYAKMVYLYKSL